MMYQLGRDVNGDEWIRCLACKCRSYIPFDIEQRYCGNCKVFHQVELKAGVLLIGKTAPDSKGFTEDE